jgi:hypothetical protein
MRILVIAIASGLLIASCSKNKKMPSITFLYGYGEVEKVNGNVKKLVDKRWSYSKQVPYFTYNFDRKGNVTKIEDFFSGDVHIGKFNTLYKTTGKKSESIGIYIDENGKEVKEVYKYDEGEDIIRYISASNNTVCDTNSFKFDSAHNLIEHIWHFNKKPLWVAKYSYVYNANGSCITSYQLFSTSRDSFKSVNRDTTRYIAFDPKNNWIKAIHNGDTLSREITYF